MFFKDEKEYKKYLEKNKVENIEGKGKYFEMTEDGEVILESSKCQNSGIDVSRYYHK